MEVGNIKRMKSDKECLPWYCVECGKEFMNSMELYQHQQETGHK